MQGRTGCLALRGPSASNPYYVRGHLLNHNLGGSGDFGANLTPLTQRANNRGGASMLRTFETPVKQAVIDQRRTVRNFTVTANPGQPSRGGDLGDIDREIGHAEATPPRPSVRPLEDLRRIRRVVNAEQYIPASLSLRAEVLASDGSASIVSAPVANTIDTDWRRYQLRRA